MKKLDLKKDLKHLYFPSAQEVTVVRVPKFNYVMIDGTGDPNTSEEFGEAVQALYSVAYTLKFMIKKEKQIDYPVMALEGLWWTEGTDGFNAQNKSAWKWRLMILQPGVVTKAYFKRAVRDATEKKGLRAFDKIRFEPYHEGLCVQILHIGRYAEEAPTIEKLHRFARERGCEPSGKHHEIYLSDPRRVRPEKMQTALRQPIRKAKGTHREQKRGVTM
jgi:hypothetical protein